VAFGIFSVLSITSMSLLLTTPPSGRDKIQGVGGAGLRNDTKPDIIFNNILIEI
jgi:hypothetical protein